MNFELTSELHELLNADKLDEAILLAEERLQKMESTDFKAVLNRNFTHLKSPLADYLDAFYKR